MKLLLRMCSARRRQRRRWRGQGQGGQGRCETRTHRKVQRGRYLHSCYTSYPHLWSAWLQLVIYHFALTFLLSARPFDLQSVGTDILSIAQFLSLSPAQIPGLPAEKMVYKFFRALMKQWEADLLKRTERLGLLPLYLLPPPLPPTKTSAFLSVKSRMYIPLWLTLVRGGGSGRWLT